jgi:hypothetical protein
MYVMKTIKETLLGFKTFALNQWVLVVLCAVLVLGYVFRDELNDMSKLSDATKPAPAFELLEDGPDSDAPTVDGGIKANEAMEGLLKEIGFSPVHANGEVVGYYLPSELTDRLLL